jgi:hypothetical protein
MEALACVFLKLPRHRITFTWRLVVGLIYGNLRKQGKKLMRCAPVSLLPPVSREPNQRVYAGPAGPVRVIVVPVRCTFHDPSMDGGRADFFFFFFVLIAGKWPELLVFSS